MNSLKRPRLCSIDAVGNIYPDSRLNADTLFNNQWRDIKSIIGEHDKGTVAYCIQIGDTWHKETATIAQVGERYQFELIERIQVQQPEPLKSSFDCNNCKKNCNSTCSKELSLELKKRLGLNEDVELRVDTENHHLNVKCSDLEQVDRIMSDRQKVSNGAVHFSFPFVNLNVGEEFEDGFSPQISRKGSKPIMTQLQAKTVVNGRKGVLEIPSLRTAQQLTDEDPDLKIIRFAIEGSELKPGIGIAAGMNCDRGSGLSREDWEARDMDAPTPKGDRTWIPEEWKRFCQDLVTHLYLPEYQWKAHLYTGELVCITANVQLAHCHGLARVVKTLNVEMI